MKTLILILIAGVISALTSCATSPSQQETTPSQEKHGNADVIFVNVIENREGSWTFQVTVSHPDTGWDDYADGWDVVLSDETVVKPDTSAKFTRTLLHPHVDEQPFTRSQSDIIIPIEVSTVRVRAHDIIDGYGGQEIIVDLDADEGNGFQVERIP